MSMITSCLAKPEAVSPVALGADDHLTEGVRVVENALALAQLVGAQGAARSQGEGFEDGLAFRADVAADFDVVDEDLAALRHVVDEPAPARRRRAAAVRRCSRRRWNRRSRCARKSFGCARRPSARACGRKGPRRRCKARRARRRRRTARRGAAWRRRAGCRESRRPRRASGGRRVTAKVTIRLSLSMETPCRTSTTACR